SERSSSDRRKCGESWTSSTAPRPSQYSHTSCRPQHAGQGISLRSITHLPVPLRPGLRVARRRAVGDVLAGACEAASWGAAHAQIQLARWQRDRLLALSDGRLDALDVARDAVGVAGLDGDELDRMLAALCGASLRLHLVEPRGIGILVEEGAVDAGQDGH